ncbi:hypothetical protein VTH06DRAFT_4292 [Thermothelomyces fergusii]
MRAPQLHPSSPPSSPLSVLSQSPSPPSPAVAGLRPYPSPSSSVHTSGSASPLKPCEMRDSTEEIRVRTDEPPPAKRRRIVAPPKPRTTAYVDLEKCGVEEDENLQRLLSALRKKKKIVVIAGAGISVSAGIPDFRSSTGLFATARGQHRLKASGKHLFDASVYKHDASTESFHTMVRELAQITSKAKPTRFHHMLASIAAEGRLLRMYSQNIDTLDTQMPPLATTVPLNAKGPWPTTVQLHGGLEKMVCTKCGHIEPFNAALFEGPEPPLCEKCKEQDEVRTAFAGKRSHGIGRLRPRIVLYNEYNPDEEAIGNVAKADLRRVPDAVIVVGTSLKIPGVRRIVKEMCQLTRSRRDGLTAWINIDPEPPGAEFKDCWDVVVRGKSDDIAELVNLPPWDQQDIGNPEGYMVSGDEQKEKRRAYSLKRDRIDVLLERKRPGGTDDEGPAPSQTVTEGSMPTPSGTPRALSPVPTAKPVAARGKSKQGTIPFGNGLPSKPAQPAKAPAGPDVPRHQGQRRGAPPPKDVIKTPRKQPPSPPDPYSSSDLSSPLGLPDDLAGLPSLRPEESKAGKAAPLAILTKPPDADGHAAARLRKRKAESGAPVTPTEDSNPAALGTVSPRSKPRSMCHLID